MLVIHCRVCGAVNDEEAKFCLDCGRKLSSGSEPGVSPTPGESKPRRQIKTEVISIPARPDDSATAETTVPVSAQPATASLAPVERSSVELMKVTEFEPDHTTEESAGTRAARELARASGLSPQSRFSSPLRVLIAGLALLLTFGAWLIYRDQSQASSSVGRNGLNLMAPDEISRKMMLLGERYREEGNYESAIENFREALELTPRDTQAQFLLARTLYSVGRVDEAVQSYNRLLETDPKHLEARLYLADIYRNRGQWNEAEREYRRLINLDPHSEQAQAAIDALEKAIAERPSNYTLLSAMRRNSRQRQAPGKYLPPAADHSSVTLPVSELALGSVPTMPSGNEAEERAELERSRRNLATAYKNRGNHLVSARRFADAISEYKKAQDFTPEDPDLNYLLGSAFYQAGQYAVATDYYRRCTSGQYASVARNSVKRADEEARKAAKKQKKFSTN
jgi:tetratricopeptide (TPR) repeat protein